MRDRWVTDNVLDARCAAQVLLTPEVGQTYRVQYDFYGPYDCTLKLLD